jgi:hypothetical protein
MKLSLFNGGLNTRQAPELIGPNEAISCTNVDTTTDQLVSAKGLDLGYPQSAAPYYFEADGLWFDQADIRSYVEYQGKLYWSDGSTAKKYYNNKTENLGIEEPSAISASVGAAGILDGVYQYVYTYYNVNDDTESQPSPISSEITAVNEAINVTVTASSDPQVTNIKLYRIGVGLLSFTEVAEVSNTTQTITDNLAFEDVTGDTLKSALYGKAPSGLKYLTEASGTFFGAVGPKLYFTLDLGNPNYWPETYYIDFHLDITGIAAIANGLVVFTKYETYLISGTNSATFVKYLLDSSQGCINYKSIVKYKGQALFISTDGLCVVSGSSVEVVSKFKLGKQSFDVTSAVMYDEAYYAQLPNGQIFTFDTRFAPVFKYYDFETDYLVVAQDVLYAIKGTNMHRMFEGLPVELTYQTGNLTEGSSSMLKTYDAIYLAGSGTWTITTYVDSNVFSYEVTLSEFPTEIAIPQPYSRGTSISFKFEGIGTIKELEYKAGSRKNGR